MTIALIGLGCLLIGLVVGFMLGVLVAEAGMDVERRE